MNNQPIFTELVELLNKEIIPFNVKDKKSLKTLTEHIGEARFVLMGEASHGSEEFYQARIELSKLLIKEKGFHAITIEGDWPSAYEVHRYIQGKSEDDEIKALNTFQRFPEWMWRNTTIPPFLKWLKAHNDHLSSAAYKVGFYGLDLYSLHDSIRAIIDYLKKYQPDAVEKAIARYSCFDHMALDPQMYGYLVNQLKKKDCIKQVTDQFLEMQHQALTKLQEKMSDHESLYFATQNARLVKNAEEYYRGMFESGVISWNLRDQHMAQTLSNLVTHIESAINEPSKIIIWAHNSHVGDARATEMNERGEINLGQIVREQYDTTSYLLGFSTYHGTVRAAPDWDCESEIKKVLPALEGSYEDLFHAASKPNFFLNLRGESHLIRLLKQAELQRAIGVIYLPETERMSHYHFARLPYQFDGLIHIDKTNAVIPLKEENHFADEEVPETYPSGI